MIEELPEGWALATGRELFEFLRGVSFKKEDAKEQPANGDVAILRAGNLQEGRVLFDDLIYVASEFVAEEQHLRTGDLVIAMSSGSASVVGKVSVVESDLKNVSYGAFCGLIRPLHPDFAGWLRHYFQTQSYRQHISDQSAGVNINNLRAEHLLSLEFPLPPLPEQRRIVAKIEELTARSRAARAALAEVPTLLEQFRQSVLASAFRGDLTADWRAKHPHTEPASELLARIRTERRKQWEAKYPKKKYAEPEPVDDSDLPELPEGWCWASLPELTSPTETLCYGVVQPGEAVENGVNLIRVCDIRDGEVRTTELRNISAEIDREYARSRIMGGELLLTVVGTIGRVAVAPLELRGSNIARAVAKLVPCSAVPATWLADWFSTSFMQDWLGREACEVARKTLNLKELDRAVIPLAPSSEMQQLVTLIPSMLKRTQAIVAWVAEGQQELDALDQSLLAKAFRGELVPQDPADEPASVLLERIKAESATAGPARRGRKGAKK